MSIQIFGFMSALYDKVWHDLSCWGSQLALYTDNCHIVGEGEGFFLFFILFYFFAGGRGKCEEKNWGVWITATCSLQAYIYQIGSKTTFQFNSEHHITLKHFRATNPTMTTRNFLKIRYQFGHWQNASMKFGFLPGFRRLCWQPKQVFGSLYRLFATESDMSSKGVIGNKWWYDLARWGDETRVSPHTQHSVGSSHTRALHLGHV